MNPIGIFAIILALTVGYYAFTGDFGTSLGNFGFGRGPIATGPGAGAEVENPEPVSRGFLGFGAESTPEPPPTPRLGESPYKGKVSITNVHRSGESPDGEYVTIRYGGGFFGFGRDSGTELPIGVTGWSVSSRKLTETLPRAYNIPEIDASQQDIILSSGGEVIVLIGLQNYQKNFRENTCVGYLNEIYDFTPSLSNSCADSRPDRSQLLSRGFNGECINTIEAVPTCRAPQGQFDAGIIGPECADHLRQNFSYAGCVKNFRSQRNFLDNTWRVSLKRSTKMFDPLHDRVTLRDANGLLVDEFEY